VEIFEESDLLDIIEAISKINFETWRAICQNLNLLDLPTETNRENLLGENQQSQPESGILNTTTKIR
jgi:hypothetical protein